MAKTTTRQRVRSCDSELFTILMDATHPNLGNLQPTVLVETYWKFAAERQRIYEKRVAGDLQPWTDDPILRRYKFTNVFRAVDRVSQYLIKEVIYHPDASTNSKEVVFRVLLFKLFNSIPAWEVLRDAFGIPTWKCFNEQAYSKTLGDAWKKGAQIWNTAYILNPIEQYKESSENKHPRYLRLLNAMMSSGVTEKLQAARTYAEAYQVLRTYPIHGEFIAMQHLTDLNYSEVLEFDEDDFIVAGPGALDGMQKCFGIRTDQSFAREIINLFVKDQEIFFDQVAGAQPVRLKGKRRLHAIDCQNLFCETDKYARLAHPQFKGGRTEIKQKLKPRGPLPAPFFPTKWGI